MSKYCRNCGTEIGESKFCPNCGSASDGSSGTLNNLKNINLQKYISIIFPVAYIILIFSKWFKVSIPPIFEKTYTIYGFLMNSGEYCLTSTLDGILGVFPLIDYIALIVSLTFCIMPILILYNSIRACSCIIKGIDNRAKYISSASVMAIIEAILAIIFTFIFKVGLSGYALDEFSNALQITMAPIFLLIIGILGKIFANKQRPNVIWIERKRETKTTIF